MTLIAMLLRFKHRYNKMDAILKLCGASWKSRNRMIVEMWKEDRGE